MRLTVKLFATYREGRFEIAEMERPDGSTVDNLLDDLAIPRAELGFVLVQGRHVELDSLLKANTTVSIFPKVGGG
ncbi:MAG: MoaD/ThiS family protein [Proteobacteria bacterium]|nr:MoaD/ThiS family protein [Pseudomonadota bacterium]